jgi:hypothetical protein
MPPHLTVKLGTYLMELKVNGRREVSADHGLEPLFAGSLEYAGCGKIQHLTAAAGPRPRSASA